MAEATKARVKTTTARGESGGLGKFVGTLLCAGGLVAALVGLIGEDVSPETMGMILGVAGYALGARAAGVFTIVVSTATLILALMISSGELAGLGG